MAVKQARRRSARSRVDRTKATKGSLWRRYLRALGPGFVTGASDDDPSGIATYAQAGAKFGFGFLWTALLTFPLMASVQEICDRTALATGKGLGELARKRLGRWWRPILGVLLVGLIGANALNITADLLAVGSGMNLLHAGPPWVSALIGGILLSALLMAGSFRLIAKVFKALCLALFAYVAELFLVHVHWSAVLADTIVPHVQWNRTYVSLLVAVLGTTISPYLFFWQSTHRLQELRDEPEGGDGAVSLKRRTSRNARKEEVNARMDVVTGMGFSNLVMWAIILVTATTLAAHGRHGIQTAAQAAAALKPVAGSFASLVFALGFVGAGMLAVPVLAGSGAAGMAGLLGKRWGFSRSFTDAPVFYALVLVGTVGGTVLSLFHFNPIKLLVLSAIVNGVAAAPFLVLVMLISGSEKVMGKFKNGLLGSSLGCITVALMASAAGAMLLSGAS